MKKLLIPLIAAFAANTVSAAAPQQVIDISTDKVSMVLTAAPEAKFISATSADASTIRRRWPTTRATAAVTTEPRTWPIPRREAATSANPLCASPMPTAT